MQMSGDLSLYFHIPFCTKKCPYCHFYVVGNSEPLKDELLIGFKKEWQSVQEKLSSYTPVSIYFGGGTPSLFGVKRLETLLSYINRKFSLTTEIEITLEANPETIDAELLRSYRSIGVNRLSLGVQSFEEEKLSLLGRTHSVQKARDTVLLAHSLGFDNISIDLMYELPHQTVTGWHESLHQALKLPITHLSLYNLTIEPHTAFFRQRETLTPHLPSDEDAGRMYTDAIEQFTRSGFIHYEISAFCKPGYHSRHNTGYWTGRPFWGFGPSAFSYFDKKRFQNVCNLKRYLALLENGKSPIDFIDEVDDISRTKELFAVGLRMLEGIDLQAFETKFGRLQPDTIDGVKKLISLGLLEQKGQLLKLTKKGILFYDTLASELI